PERPGRGRWPHPFSCWGRARSPLVSRPFLLVRSRFPLVSRPFLLVRSRFPSVSRPFLLGRSRFPLVSRPDRSRRCKELRKGCGDGSGEADERLGRIRG